MRRKPKIWLTSPKMMRARSEMAKNVKTAGSTSSVLKPSLCGIFN